MNPGQNCNLDELLRGVSVLGQHDVSFHTYYKWTDSVASTVQLQLTVKMAVVGVMQTEGCCKEAQLQCPTCNKFGIPGAYFYSQACFKGSWRALKRLHKKARMEHQPETHKVVSPIEHQPEANMATSSPELQLETHKVVSTAELQPEVMVATISPRGGLIPRAPA